MLRIGRGKRLMLRHSNIIRSRTISSHTMIRSRHRPILISNNMIAHYRYYDLVRAMSSSTATNVKPKTEIDTLLEEVSSETKPTEVKDEKTQEKEVETEAVAKQKPPLWTRIKDEAKHYWFGTKLLFTELKIATRHLSRVLQGHSLSRRERKQLVRTANDMMRLVPFSIFVLIPFMELLLPVALAIFPGMLPSTYQTSKKRSENMKRRLRARIEMASFLQDVMEESAKDIKSRHEGSEKLQATADDLLAIVEKARKGHPMSNESVLTISKLFQDDITLDTMSRPQLVTLCHFVGITVFGTLCVSFFFFFRIITCKILQQRRYTKWRHENATSSTTSCNQSRRSYDYVGRNPRSEQDRARAGMSGSWYASYGTQRVRVTSSTSTMA